MTSHLSCDPLLAELIAMFVAELPQRLAGVRNALCGGDRREVQRLAHQLVGAGGSYGFPNLTDAARKLEAATHGSCSSAELIDAFNRLTEVCSDICAADPL